MAYKNYSTAPSLNVTLPALYNTSLISGVLTNAGITKDIVLPTGVYNAYASQSGVNLEIGKNLYSLAPGNTVFSLGGTNTLTSVQPAFTNNLPIWSAVYPNNISDLQIIKVKYVNNMYFALPYLDGTGGNPNVIAYSTDAITWSKSTIQDRRYWYDISYGAGKYMLSHLNNGEYNYYLSTNLVTWTKHTSPGAATSATIYYTTYGDYGFVALFNSTQSSRSTDGVTWTSLINMPSVNGSYRPIKFKNGKYMTTPNVTTNQGIAFSDTGTSWTYYTVPPTATNSGGYVVDYGNNIYVGVSNSTSAITSADGITWTLRTVVQYASFSDIEYGNGIFVALGYDSGVSLNTPDNGFTWTSSSYSSIFQPSSATYGNGKFIYTSTNSNYKGSIGIAAPNPVSAIGFGFYAGAGTRNYQESSEIGVKTSTPTVLGDYVILDGLLRRAGNSSVSRSSASSIPTNTYKLVNGAIKYDSTFIVQASDPGNVNIGSMTYNIPGSTPTIINHDYLENKNVFEFSSNNAISFVNNAMSSSELWTGVTYSRGQFIALSSTGKTSRSTDGATWIAGTQLAAGTYGVIASSSVRYSILQSGSTTVQYSSDGITWSLGTTPAIREWAAGAYGNGRFVFGAKDTNYLITSQSGFSSWSGFNIPSAISSICYGKGIFIATPNTPLFSTTSSIIVSRDGNAGGWTSAAVPVASRFTCSAYGNGTFLLPAWNTNTFYYSTDTVSWAVGNFPITSNWNSCTYGNGRFLVVSEDGNMVWSTDLITWSTQSSGTNWGNYLTAYGSGKHVVIGKFVGSATDTSLFSNENPVRTNSIHFGIYGADWEVV